MNTQDINTRLAEFMEFIFIPNNGEDYSSGASTIGSWRTLKGERIEESSWRPSDDEYNFAYYQIHLCEMKLKEMGKNKAGISYYSTYVHTLDGIVMRDYEEAGGENAGLLWFAQRTALPSQRARAIINVLEGE